MSDKLSSSLTNINLTDTDSSTIEGKNDVSLYKKIINRKTSDEEKYKLI